MSKSQKQQENPTKIDINPEIKTIKEIKIYRSQVIDDIIARDNKYKSMISFERQKKLKNIKIRKRSSLFNENKPKNAYTTRQIINNINARNPSFKLLNPSTPFLVGTVELNPQKTNLAEIISEIPSCLDYLKHLIPKTSQTSKIFAFLQSCFEELKSNYEQSLEYIRNLEGKLSERQICINRLISRKLHYKRLCNKISKDGIEENMEAKMFSSLPTGPNKNELKLQTKINELNEKITFQEKTLEEYKGKETKYSAFIAALNNRGYPVQEIFTHDLPHFLSPKSSALNFIPQKLPVFFDDISSSSSEL